MKGFIFTVIATFCFTSPAFASGPLSNLLVKIQSSLDQGVSSHEECFEKASKAYQDFFNLRSEDADLDSFSEGELDNLIKESFKTRIKMRRLMYAFNPEAESAAACIDSARGLNRALRYFEDYLVENLERRNPKDSYTSLSGIGSFFLKNPKYDFASYEDLQSGDVILSRGGAYSSAAIARVGISDAQFSHLSFVYKDEDGQLHTTEAHIEIGSVVAPINEHIEQGNVREVVFRFKDRDLAARASKMIYEKVKKRSEDEGNIPYDFGMDYKNNEWLFCSEIISHGFELASGNSVRVPLNKTKFPRGLIPFLRLIGVDVDEDNIETFDTFAPGDIEFDPRFELVAEWRRPDRLEDSRQKDAVLNKVFEWMEKERYRFKPGFGMGLKSYSAWVLRRLPFIKKKLEEKFPLNMKTSMLKTFLVLDEVGEVLQNRIRKEQELADGIMSFQEMLRTLEEFREADKQMPIKSSKFHGRFRPPMAIK